METITEEELKLLEELEKKATPAPWEEGGEEGNKVFYRFYEKDLDRVLNTSNADGLREWVNVQSYRVFEMDTDGNFRWRNDLKFILTLRSILPRLLKGYRDLQQMNKISDGVYKIMKILRRYDDLYLFFKNSIWMVRSPLLIKIYEWIQLFFRFRFSKNSHKRKTITLKPKGDSHVK